MLGSPKGPTWPMSQLTPEDFDPAVAKLLESANRRLGFLHTTKFQIGVVTTPYDSK